MPKIVPTDEEAEAAGLYCLKLCIDRAGGADNGVMLLTLLRLRLKQKTRSDLNGLIETSREDLYVRTALPHPNMVDFVLYQLKKRGLIEIVDPAGLYLPMYVRILVTDGLPDDMTIAVEHG